MIPLATLLLFVSPLAPLADASVAAHPEPVADAVPAAPNGKAIKALKEWLKTYRTGKLDLVSKADTERKSLSRKYGLIDDSYADVLTARRDLELILESVGAEDTEEAAELLLEVAAIGLDEGRMKYSYEMAPNSVRELGETCLGRLTSEAALTYIEKVARGDIKPDKYYGEGMRAAAARFLGNRDNPAARELLTTLLTDGDVPVRLAATESIGKHGHESSIEPLARCLGNETNESVLTALVQALRRCMQTVAQQAQQNPGAIPESARLAVRAVVGALGRTSWRADMQIVGFLSDFRSAETIPALIDLLQRFVDNPDEVASGKLSGLLQHRVHETLVAMTGAIYSADKPAQWREFWQREQANILAAKPAPPKAKGGDDDTASKGFFGIPVQGTRVLFVVDLSGSMAFEMGNATTTGGKAAARRRLDYAQQELLAAVDKLPENTLLNFVTYNGNPKAKVWAKDMVKADSKNKERARKFILEMRADGGTNMWAGLQSALQMKSLIYGDRYDSNVDEMFIVSDGAPSVGDITEPEEIRRLVAETNRFSGVRINTVFITSPNPQNPVGVTLKPEDLMRLLAEQNGGRFIEIKG